MFEKKFRVRIRQGLVRYYVEYAHYYIFPRYKRLYKWLPSLKEWNTFSADYYAAKAFAQTLCSMDDVDAFNAQQASLADRPRKQPKIEYITCQESRI